MKDRHSLPSMSSVNFHYPLVWEVISSVSTKEILVCLWPQVGWRMLSKLKVKAFPLFLLLTKMGGVGDLGFFCLFVYFFLFRVLNILIMESWHEITWAFELNYSSLKSKKQRKLSFQKGFLNSGAPVVSRNVLRF